MAKSDKQKHTMSCCKQCREEYYHLQAAFPAQSMLSHPKPSAVSLSCMTTSEKDLTRSVPKDLNGEYVQFGHTFVHYMVQSCKDVEQKFKAEKDEQIRKCRDQVNKWHKQLH